MSPAEERVVEAQPDRGPTILVVEDETLVRMGVAEHLRDGGFVVIEAANGDEAKAVLEAGVAVDLVFSDVNMPGAVDGVELAYWLGAQSSAPPIMLTSGVPDMLTRARERCPHVREFVSKPYAYDELEQHIRELLRRSV